MKAFKEMISDILCVCERERVSRRGDELSLESAGSQTIKAGKVRKRQQKTVSLTSFGPGWAVQSAVIPEPRRGRACGADARRELHNQPRSPHVECVYTVIDTSYINIEEKNFVFLGTILQQNINHTHMPAYNRKAQ